MNYELAKELKDAGFPQMDYHGSRWGTVDDGFSIIWSHEGGKYHPINAARFVADSLEDLVYIPTLSELIRACGDELNTLVHHTQSIESGIHDWSANSYDREINCMGSTPEEAVATLWLALNKHD